MVLFLDGSAERMASVASRMDTESCRNVIWCKNVKEAITVLKDYSASLTLLVLDHDLGTPDQRFQSPDSGMEITRFLFKNKEITKKLVSNNCKVVVNSWNVAAGRIMRERMEELGFSVVFKPFGL